MAFAPIRRYLSNNLDNNDIDNNENKQVYGEMYIVDWLCIT